MKSEQRHTSANGIVYVAVPITPGRVPRCADCDCRGKTVCLVLACSSDTRRDKRDVIWKKETSLRRTPTLCKEIPMTEESRCVDKYGVVCFAIPLVGIRHLPSTTRCKLCDLDTSYLCSRVRCSKDARKDGIDVVWKKEAPRPDPNPL